MQNAVVREDLNSFFNVRWCDPLISHHVGNRTLVCKPLLPTLINGMSTGGIDTNNSIFGKNPLNDRLLTDMDNYYDMGINKTSENYDMGINKTSENSYYPGQADFGHPWRPPSFNFIIPHNNNNNYTNSRELRMDTRKTYMRYLEKFKNDNSVYSLDYRDEPTQSDRHHKWWLPPPLLPPARKFVPPPPPGGPLDPDLANIAPPLPLTRKRHLNLELGKRHTRRSLSKLLPKIANRQAHLAPPPQQPHHRQPVHRAHDKLREEEENAWNQINVNERARKNARNARNLANETQRKAQMEINLQRIRVNETHVPNVSTSRELSRIALQEANTSSIETATIVKNALEVTNNILFSLEFS